MCSYRSRLESTEFEFAQEPLTPACTSGRFSPRCLIFTKKTGDRAKSCRPVSQALQLCTRASLKSVRGSAKNPPSGTCYVFTQTLQKSCIAPTCHFMSSHECSCDVLLLIISLPGPFQPPANSFPCVPPEILAKWSVCLEMARFLCSRMTLFRDVSMCSAMIRFLCIVLGALLLVLPALYC